MVKSSLYQMANSNSATIWILNSENVTNYTGYNIRYINLRRRKKVSILKEAKKTLIVQNFPH